MMSIAPGVCDPVESIHRQSFLLFLGTLFPYLEIDHQTT